MASGAPTSRSSSLVLKAVPVPSRYLAGFQLPVGGILKPQGDLGHSNWAGAFTEKLGYPLLEILFVLRVAWRWRHIWWSVARADPTVEPFRGDSAFESGPLQENIARVLPKFDEVRIHFVVIVRIVEEWIVRSLLNRGRGGVP